MKSASMKSAKFKVNEKSIRLGTDWVGYLEDCDEIASEQNKI